MDRRNFLRSILGVAASTALPSEIWPFRKIFISAASKLIVPDQNIFYERERIRLIDAAIEAIELKSFSKQLPDLIVGDWCREFKQGPLQIPPRYKVMGIDHSKKEITFEPI